jgi:transcriptional regulator with XRE-family HTH domain
LRAQKGISQKKLAEDLIITRVRLAKYEEGISEPPFDILKSTISNLLTLFTRWGV